MSSNLLPWNGKCHHNAIYLDLIKVGYLLAAIKIKPKAHWHLISYDLHVDTHKVKWTGQCSEWGRLESRCPSSESSIQRGVSTNAIFPPQTHNWLLSTASLRYSRRWIAIRSTFSNANCSNVDNGMETDRPVEYDMYIVGWDMELMTSFGRYAVLNGG